MKLLQKSTTTKIIAIGVFYAIAIIFRYLSIKTPLLEHIDNSFLKIVLQGIGPAIGALVAFKIFGLKTSYSLSGKLKPTLLSFIVFVVVPVIGFAVIGLVENESIIVSSNVYMAGAKLSFYFMIYAILEEVGWRAFLNDQLSFVNPYLKIVIVGLLWFIWHLNFELSISNFSFMLILILASWGIGKIGNVTQSILAVGAFHALYNIFQLSCFDYKEKIFVLFLSASIWICYVVFYNKLNRSIIGSKK